MSLSLDGMAIRALAEELQHALPGARVDKIIQPSTQSVLFQLHRQKETFMLLGSVNAQNTRLCLTHMRPPSLKEPPMFLMVLRKHLSGATIQSVRQVDWERIIEITFAARNEIGEPVTRIMLAELMGKSSNVLLLDEDGIILDAMRRIGRSTNRYRQILPGLPYVPPPEQDKISIDQLNDEALIAAILAEPETRALKKILLEKLAGVGPQTVRHLLDAAGLDADATNATLGALDYERLTEAIAGLRRRIHQGDWAPTLLKDGPDILGFAPFPLAGYGERNHPQTTMSVLLERYYDLKEAQEKFQQKKHNLTASLQQELNRCQKKLGHQLDKIYEAESCEPLRIYGELLTANLYRLRQGPEAVVTNFYDPDQTPMTIPMDASKTPNENAQQYFKKYNKAKNGAQKAEEQARRTEEELRYLESVALSLDQADNLDDLKEIRLELEDAGYLKRRDKAPSKKDAKDTPSQPLHVVFDTFDIFVGRNNRQNDQLTLKMSRGSDLWLHTKDIHGAHVIIRHQHNTDFPDHVVEKAALLAAWFSKGRNSAQVPVDVTYKKFVHKPNGARPGMVIYTDQRTVYVTPDAGEVAKLLNAPHSEEASCSFT